MDNNILKIQILSATKCVVHELRPLMFDPVYFKQKLDLLVGLVRNSQRKLDFVGRLLWRA